jgi:Tectonin domain
MQGEETMKMHGIIATMAAMLFATMASAQSPSNTNAVWGVNDQNEVFRWDLPRNEFVRMPGSLKQVSVGADGEVWGVDPDGDIRRWLNSQWQPVPGKLKQLSVRNAQEVWGVDDANALFRWTGSAWEPIVEDGRPVLPAVFVSAGADGTVWGIGPGEGAIITISA